MLRMLGRLIALAGVVEAARRFAKQNPEVVGKLVDQAGRLAFQLEAIAAAAEAGLKDHDRWLTGRNLLARKLAGRRSTSSLPALLDYVLARPIVSAGMIARELKITSRAAQDLVGELGLREATGRRRYRAWGIF